MDGEIRRGEGQTAPPRFLSFPFFKVEVGGWGGGESLLSQGYWECQLDDSKDCFAFLFGKALKN